MRKAIMAFLLCVLFLVPVVHALTYRTGAVDGPAFDQTGNLVGIPSTMTLTPVLGGPSVTLTGTGAALAANFNVNFDAVYDITYVSPGYQTDTDDFYFDSKLQSCVQGSDCTMLTDHYSTSCDYKSLSVDWVCRVTDVNNGQWYSFIYKKNDPAYGEVIRSWNAMFPIVPSNQDPILDPIGNRVVNEGQNIQFTVSATDPNGDPLIFDTGNIAPLPSGATFNEASRTFSWTPNFNQAGSYQVTFYVRDPFGAYDKETVTITVVDVPVVNPPGPNQPPFFTSTPVRNADLNVQYLYDADAVDPNGDALTYSLEKAPQGMTINPSTGLVVWTPTENGKHEIVIAVTDATFIVRQRYTINAGFSFSSIARKVLKLTRISAVGECYTPGSEVPVLTSADNKADSDLDDVTYVASIPQLALRKSSGPRDIKEDRGETRQVYIELPKETPVGEYNVRVVMSNDEVRRVRNRPVQVAETC